MHRDGDGDGVYETPIAEVISTTDPFAVGDVVPGHYRITEIAPPPGTC